MRLRELESKLQRLREEKERFLELLHSTDKRLARGEITKYQKQFTINSITHGLTENEYLRMVDRDISETQKEISSEIRNSPLMKNIFIISLGVIAILVLLFFLIVPEILKLQSEQVKEFVIPVEATFTESQKIYPSILQEEGSVIRSFHLSGAYRGDVQVYVVSNITGQRIIIYDSKKYGQEIISITGNLLVINGDPSSDGILLNEVCEETCRLEL
ncbi:MAG TPA: hypothetical protein VEC16_03870, partial [Alphaproteobacteria bacterium]|nr:hypothetical protein [Alphaproteobacteria bacterium]